MEGILLGTTIAITNNKMLVYVWAALKKLQNVKGVKEQLMWWPYYDSLSRPLTELDTTQKVMLDVINTITSLRASPMFLLKMCWFLFFLSFICNLCQMFAQFRFKSYLCV